VADNLAAHLAVAQIRICVFAMVRVSHFAGFASISLRLFTAISVAVPAAVSAVISTVISTEIPTVSGVVIETRRCVLSRIVSRIPVSFIVSFSASSLLVTTALVYARGSLKTTTVPVYTSTRVRLRVRNVQNFIVQAHH